MKVQQRDEVHCDVSLVTEDGFVLRAHKAILASTSPYFSRELADYPAESHISIVLSGINYQELTCLIDYMYEGFTKVIYLNTFTSLCLLFNEK